MCKNSPQVTSFSFAPSLKRLSRLGEKTVLIISNSGICQQLCSLYNPGSFAFLRPPKWMTEPQKAIIFLLVFLLSAQKIRVLELFNPFLMH